MNKIFKTFNELTEDKIFIDAVTKNLIKLIQERSSRKPAPKGMRYKRDWYDKFGHKLDLVFCLQNIEAIWMKKSNLPSLERQVIQYVCDKAYRETMQKYSEIIDPADVYKLNDISEQGVILNQIDNLQP